MSNLGAPLGMGEDDEERALDEIEFQETEFDLSEEEVHAELNRLRRDPLDELEKEF